MMKGTKVDDGYHGENRHSHAILIYCRVRTPSPRSAFQTMVWTVFTDYSGGDMTEHSIPRVLVLISPICGAET